MLGAPPNCRSECVIHEDCPSNRACQNQKCVDPCIGSCGWSAKCTVQNHKPICSCIEGYEGDPYASCTEKRVVYPIEIVHPCNPSPCGTNAICREQNGAGSCACIQNYYGDPYIGCRPECIQNSDCPHDKACFNTKCVSPCPGTCGQNAVCNVVNHVPICTCVSGYTGNALVNCHRVPPIEHVEPQYPCRPSPCGPFSICREVDNRAICSCQPNYIGGPPNCRPECTTSSECSRDRSCVNFRCVDPCPGVCGPNARCRVVNHNPICSCNRGFTGDPFVQCSPEQRPPVVSDDPNPCLPNPCGPNSNCRVHESQPVCSCIANYIGLPKNCRPECTVNSECPSNKACINEKCRDPCVGACAFNAECHVRAHTPRCTCSIGYEGDPFSGCHKIAPIKDEIPQPCKPSPCGANAICKERNGAGSCSCIPEYFGDTYVECRPECVMNSDCPKSRSCNNNKCVDPCPILCGQNAICQVTNHNPTCYCINDYVGDPFVRCNPPPIHDEPIIDPCSPSPCGPYSQCRTVNAHAVCSCVSNYIGTPPNCRPECVVSSECTLDRSCINMKCKDPCPGTCGLNARCRVVNHNAICSCNAGFVGDPFVRCLKEEIKKPVVVFDPCYPSPCGPNSNCRVIGDTGVCSCLDNYIGRPPNCRPECTLNSECPRNLACINEKCKDPCPGSCGSYTTCTVNNHQPICTCYNQYTGDPFSSCSPIIIQHEPEIPEPCNPSPCGANALCKERNGAGSCVCLPEYHGDPYVECRPECVMNSDCPKSRACINNKRKDPCPGVCGQSAECHVANHSPHCSCFAGYTGNPSIACHLIPIRTLIDNEK